MKDVTGTVMALLSAVLLAACSGGGAQVDSLPDDARISYAFHDASIPPQYHRSITLTVTRDTSRLVVDSYGDVLADESRPTPPDVWRDMSDSITELAARTPDALEEDCTGGTGMDVVVESGDSRLLDLSAQFCAGANAGLESAIRTWITPARNLFPPTDVLAPPGADSP